jgi:hypothetical protein
MNERGTSATSGPLIHQEVRLTPAQVEDLDLLAGSDSQPGQAWVLVDEVDAAVQAFLDARRPLIDKIKRAREKGRQAEIAAAIRAHDAGITYLPDANSDVVKAARARLES